jgi:hypothetical protein
VTEATPVRLESISGDVVKAVELLTAPVRDALFDICARLNRIERQLGIPPMPIAKSDRPQANRP